MAIVYQPPVMIIAVYVKDFFAFDAHYSGAALVGEVRYIGVWTC